MPKDARDAKDPGDSIMLFLLGSLASLASLGIPLAWWFEAAAMVSFFLGRP
jgi:hypothetical protein